MSDLDGLGQLTLLEAITAAGAEIDKAQVLGDVAAHRIVRAIARRAEGQVGLPDDVAGSLAIVSRRVATDIALAAARYGAAQSEHADALERLTDPPTPAALRELREIEAEGTRGGSAATELIASIDAAERAHE